jgi:hypothetical protein
VRPLLVAQREEEFELLGKQAVVVVQVVPEQRERLDERPAPRHHLGAPAREQVECGELLVHADRIVRAEHRDGAREPDATGACGGSRQHDRRRRDDVVRPMVLADAVDVEAHLLGQHDLLDEVTQPLGCRDVASRSRLTRAFAE